MLRGAVHSIRCLIWPQDLSPKILPKQGIGACFGGQGGVMQVRGIVLHEYLELPLDSEGERAKHVGPVQFGPWKFVWILSGIVRLQAY